MLRERISKIFSNRMLYIVISIIAAITLWVYVTDIDNQNTETTILGINVNFVGKDALREKGLLIDDTYNYTVSLNVLGKRDAVAKLKNTNIAINVDVSDISTAGSYDKFYSIVLPPSVSANEVYILQKKPEYVTVRINQYSTKSVSVKGSFTGNAKSGYEAKTLQFTPAAVTVGGPYNIVSRIAYASVRLSQSDVDKTLNLKLPYVFVDSNGAEVPMDKLQVNTQTIDVTLPVILVKQVPLTVKFNPGGGATESNVKYALDPKTITLSGDPDVLSKISEIPLKTYNLSEIFADQSETLAIPVPDGVTNVNNITQAKVAYAVVGLNTKNYKVSNIKITNVYTGHKATLVTKDIDVTLRGDQATLDAITADNITVTVDLTELGQSVGKYSVPAAISIGGSTKAGAIGTYTAVVTLEAT